MKSWKKCSCLTVLLLVVIFVLQGFSSIAFAATKSEEVPVAYKKATYLSGLDLSKKKGEYYTTKKEEYIDTTRFIIYLQQGVKIPVDIVYRINYVMDQIEKTTGDTFYVIERPDTDSGMQNEVELYFETAKKLLKVNSDHHKLEIIILNDNFRYSSLPVGDSGIIVDNVDADIFNESSHILYGLLYNLTQRHGVTMGSLDYGYIGYYIDILLEKDNMLTSSYRASEGYKEYNINIITEENAERIFLNHNDGNGRKIGFRMMYFITERYGKDAYQKVRKQASESPYLYGRVVPLDVISEALKKGLSKDFFEEFAKWLSENRERFGDEDLTQYGDWYIKDNELIRYFGSGTNVVIPKTVKIIGPEAFNDCETIKTVKIPNTVTDIQWSAFYDCKNLKEVVIPDSVSHLSMHVFEGCSSLKKVVLPKNLTSISTRLFLGCESLEEIVLPKGVTFIGSGVFTDNYSLKKIKLPKNLTNLEMLAFSYCRSLENIVLPKEITTIPESLFMDCINLQKIVIPDKVTSIERRAFYNNTNLKSIVIPKSVICIEEYAFDNCPNLTIYGAKGSYAETYAKQNNIPFKIMK